MLDLSLGVALIGQSALESTPVVAPECTIVPTFPRCSYLEPFTCSVACLAPVAI